MNDPRTGSRRKSGRDKAARLAAYLTAGASPALLATPTADAGIIVLDVGPAGLGFRRRQLARRSGSLPAAREMLPGSKPNGTKWCQNQLVPATKSGEHADCQFLDGKRVVLPD